MGARDNFRAKIQATPIVIQTNDADGNSRSQFQHNVNKVLRAELNYTKADANDKWAVNLNRGITTDANALGAVVVFTDGSDAVSSGDLIKLIYIKHLGISNTTGLPITDDLWLSIDGSTPSATNANGFILEPNEGIILKPTGLTYDNFHGKSSGSNSIKVEYCALMDDISAGEG